MAVYADRPTGGPAYQAYQILHLGFTIAPIVAGLDKFLHILAEWERYLAPVFPSMLGVSPHTFMYGVGLIEILAGIGVFFLPRIFAYVVAAWMLGIIVNLLVLGAYFDIALRDFGLALGAFSLGRLSETFAHHDAT